MQILRLIHAALQTTFKIFSSSFDVDLVETPLQLQLDLADLQCLKDLKINFLVCNIVDFYKNDPDR